jgi:hypothetical protein
MTLTKLAYMDFIDQATFTRRKETGRLGVTIPIKGVPVQFNGDYGSYKQASSQLKRLMNLNYSSAHHTAIYSHMLTRDGLEAYKNCASANQVGTLLWRSEDALTADKFFIGVKWKGGVGGPLGAFDFVGNSPFQVQGGLVVGAHAATPPKTILSEQEITVDIERDLTQNLRFAVSVNGYTQRLELPAYNPRNILYVPVGTPTKVASSHFGRDGNDGADVNIPTECTPTGDAEFLPMTALPIGVTGAPTSTFTLETNEPKRIVYRVRAYANTKHAGGYARGYVSVIAAATTSTVPLACRELSP